MKKIFLIITLFFSYLLSEEINNSMIVEDEIYDLNLDEINITKEEIKSNILDTNDEYSLDIAIILDKNKFFKFVPSLLNSFNAYTIKKDINYKIKLFNKEKNITKELNDITQKYKYVFIFLTNSDEVGILNNYPDNYFFIPTLNKRQTSNKIGNHIFFGGINYKNQVLKLNNYINDYTIVIYENSDLSKYITTVVDETLFEAHKVVKYPIKYNSSIFNNTFVYINTNVVNTAQILSNFTYKKIETKAIFSTQLNYTPFIFSLTNKADVDNLIIANSIFNINPIIEDNNKNLDSDIDFNWLNFTTATLLNVAYNLEIEEDINFLNDFNLYMFFNQINYKTNLYKIFNNGFIKIEN